MRAAHKLLTAALLLLLSQTCSASIATAAFTCNTACQQSQQAALQQLYAQTNGATWKEQQGWLQEASASDLALDAHCSWFGVLCCSGNSTLQGMGNGTLPCSSPGAVLQLSLPGNGLHGKLTADVLTNLTSLVVLDLPGKATSRLHGCLCSAVCSQSRHCSQCRRISACHTSGIRTAQREHPVTVCTCCCRQLPDWNFAGSHL